MKIKILSFVSILIFIGCSAYNQYHASWISSDRFPPKSNLKVAVLPFTAPKPGKSSSALMTGATESTTHENAGETVADAVTMALMAVPNISLIERSKLKHILEEHRLTLNGIIDNPDLNLLATILPVDALIIGNVTSFCWWTSGINWGSTVSFTGKLIDIHSGEILSTFNCSAILHNGEAGEMARSLANDAIKKSLKQYPPPKT